MSRKKQSKNSFKNDVESTPLLKDAYKSGLRALGNYSSKVSPTDTSKCQGSVDIDVAVKSIYPNACRWDYVVGYGDQRYFIEVHSAKTNEVKAVLNKLQWLKDFLVKDAPKLDNGKRSFYWIASNGIHILPNSPQFRQLATKGIKVVGQLDLQ
ncbi:hypothetical protein [Pseudanabaena sp. 'Roaring Creek']|uniref:hypothetical protein n=1 Tax=Pseudanabaena sp. 'Roaring Creek' TaxID=1681830 RepID=UPI0006D7A6E1|nr:hypothetical protein [Pseudanabaena sp. 'Roaring Creek']